jgi:hypothetical protein
MASRAIRRKSEMMKANANAGSKKKHFGGAPVRFAAKKKAG